MKILRGAHHGIPWRCHEISRIEALSDAVFAFAVTLLVVALEVPQTFSELWVKMHGFLAFAVCFAMLFQVWYLQHSFFRRYGLQDALTVALNGALLFVVLVYVYPLKFLFGWFANQLTGLKGMVEVGGRQVPMVATMDEARVLMMVYGIGFTAVFLIFFLLYLRALRLSGDLGLSAKEIENGRETMYENLMMVIIGTLSLTLLFITGNPAVAGFTYMLIGVGQSLFGVFWRRAHKE